MPGAAKDDAMSVRRYAASALVATAGLGLLAGLAGWALPRRPTAGILTLAAPVPPAPSPGAPLRRPFAFRALTYNIRHGARDDGRVDLEAVARVIRASGADVVALQEVDVRQFRSGLEDQARWLGRRLGMEVVFAPTMRRGLGLYGNALLSRFPVRAAHSLLLPGRLEPRGALVAHLATPGGAVTVVATHLGLSAADRRAQAAALARELAGVRGPVVLLGDWNAEAGAPELAPLLARFLPAAPGPDGPSLTLRRPGGALYAAPDRVLVSPGLGVVEARVLPEAVSDHLPVLALLTLGAEG